VIVSCTRAYALTPFRLSKRHARSMNSLRYTAAGVCCRQNGQLTLTVRLRMAAKDDGGNQRCQSLHGLD
jgi:hypothetical protein